MNDAVQIPSRHDAKVFLATIGDASDQREVQRLIHESLRKLNSVEERMDRLEKKGFLSRVYGGISGKTSKEMVAVFRDLSSAQRHTLELVLALAVMHGENQLILDGILSELQQSKGTYTRITDHIEFLYGQVLLVKNSQKVEKSQGSLGSLWRNMSMTVKNLAEKVRELVGSILHKDRKEV